MPAAVDANDGGAKEAWRAKDVAFFKKHARLGSALKIGHIDSMLNFDALLRQKGLLSETDLARAEEVRARTGSRLAATLVRLGLVPEEEIAAALAESTGFPLRQRASFPETLPAIDGVNRRFLVRRAILPIEESESMVTLAMADPTDDDARDALAFATKAHIEPCVATFADIEDLLGVEPEGGIDLGDIVSGLTAGAGGDIARLLENDSEAPIIRLVQRILSNAVNRRASDVHIEPMARHLAIRYRIDGRLQEVERHPDSFAAPIASRIKIMAGLDIAESRLPQDGRLRLTVRGREVDVRVSTSPIAHGESIVLRLLGRSEVSLDLERLGLPEAALEKFNRALDRPHGIILLTGPTGSGKTTTLYAAISRLRRPEVKILTVEDPVEVLIEGVNQVQVRPDIGLSYAATLRAFLRQDPDILMIGEIRDRETADIALRSALTGHLVLSTLHTNSALGAFTRLVDIGIEPYLTASTVIATIAQRLVRSLCPSCRTPHVPTNLEVEQFRSADIQVPAHIYDANGCESCLHSGYVGRVPLIEVVEVDDRLRGLIREGLIRDEEEERVTADSLAGHGLALVAAGRTSLAEVMRAVTLQ